MDDLVELGRTAGAYGFRGWVRIVPLESGEVLQKARTGVLTDLKGVRTTLSIEAFRRHGDGFIAKWAGCETKEAADAARGRVSVSRADFPDAGKDAVWAVDLVGCKVVVFMLPLVKDVYLIAIDTDVRTITVDWQSDWR